MGSGQSTPHEDAYGYHVLHVMENSPAEKAGIEPFFDFIVGINETRLADEDPEELMEHLVMNKGREVKLHVYSSKYDNVREINVVPNDNWGGTIRSSLIGCSIRYCSYQSAAENVWHILDVAADSPASIAGLQPYTDYIVGAPRVTLTSLDDFFDLVERHNGQEMRLHVYNVNWDSCREVMIVPNSEWGGQGSLGCNVGYGYLHRIPAQNPRRASIQHLRQQSGEHEVPLAVSNAEYHDGDRLMEPKPPQTAPADYRPPVLKKKYAVSGVSSPSVSSAAGEEGSPGAVSEVVSKAELRPQEEEEKPPADESIQEEETKQSDLDELVHMSTAGGVANEDSQTEPSAPVATVKSIAPVNTGMQSPNSPTSTSIDAPELRGTKPLPSVQSPARSPSRPPSRAKSPERAILVQQKSPTRAVPPYGDTAELMKQLSLENRQAEGGAPSS